jgi:hypothetical protein
MLSGINFTAVYAVSFAMLMLADSIGCANEDDNPVAFLRFEHPELSKETFIKEQVSIILIGFSRNLRTRL